MGERIRKIKERGQIREKDPQDGNLMKFKAILALCCLNVFTFGNIN